MRDADAKREFRRAIQRSRIAPATEFDNMTERQARDFKIFMLGVAYGAGQHEAPLLIERIVERYHDVEDIT